MNDLQKLQVIERMVTYFLRPTNFDVSDIAVKIWIILYENKQEVSWRIVRNKCIDELRKARPIFVPLESFENIKANEEDLTEERAELINELIKDTKLTPEEKIAIYKRFYNGESLKNSNIALIVKAIEKLRKTMELLRKETL